jgi:hypothetical protein
MSLSDRVCRWIQESRAKAVINERIRQENQAVIRRRFEKRQICILSRKKRREVSHKFLAPQDPGTFHGNGGSILNEIRAHGVSAGVMGFGLV